MKYNKYNMQLLEEIEDLYKNFSNTKEDYYKLLKKIYNIYYLENIFILIDNNIKYSLESILKLLKIKNNWYITYTSNKNSKEYLISLILTIHNETNFFTNFSINPKRKKEIENILFENNLISNQEIHFSSNIYDFFNKDFNNNEIINFFNQYSINFNEKFLKIKETNIPNFYLLNKNFSIDHHYEFFHLLFKIYAPILYYGKSFMEGYEYTITEKDIIFDCGGNMGLFALYAASKGATVYTFEPMSYIRDFLKISQKVYPNKIHIIPCGVSNIEKEEYFYQGVNPGASRNININIHTSDLIYKEKCKIITLDNFSKKNNIIPTFIKADIEGAEKEMILGAKNIIEKYSPVLHICLNHRIEDQFILPSLIYSINQNYSFYNFMEGKAYPKYMLCK